METVDCVVVGAGVVGLACARALALAGREVLVLEAAPAFGTGVSSRSSEVIHGGLYYPPGSLKAALCVRGRGLLYEYCAARHVPHRRCGKLVVATSHAQEAELATIAARARANGVSDVELLDAGQARRLEPELRCVAALLSPATGIIDSHALMLALLADAEAAGAMLVASTPVLGGVAGADGIELRTGGAAPMQLTARSVVNAAGLGAPALAARIDGIPATAVPRAYYAKGSYFALHGKTPFSRLLYPVPEPGGLGVHLTLDLAGQGRFGPDVEWLKDANAASWGDPPGLPPDHAYAVDPARAERFYDAIRRYWPGLPDGALAPGYAGIRPKIHGPAQAAADFRIDGMERHGISGLINLFGIESPGLTASLAIAETVADRLGAD